MNKFHIDLVTKAVLTFAFPNVSSLDEVSNLPFKEPPFRHIAPGTLLTTTTTSETTPSEDTIIISKKPEGQREILVGIVDRVDRHIYVYSMCRNKTITFVHPDDPSVPVPVSNDLIRAIQHRARGHKDADQIAFVLDVCRVYDGVSRRLFNVVLSDIGPIAVPRVDIDMFARAYLLRFKIFRTYTDENDIRSVMETPEDYPYHPDNGVVFVQTRAGGMPNLRSACAKYTPLEMSTVFLHVNPIITLKTRVWQLSTWRNDHLEPFRTIPAPAFYIPPTGAIVAFRLSVDGERWRLVPTRMRIDKMTPSSPLTLNRFIARHLPTTRSQQTSHKTESTGAVEGASAGAGGGSDETETNAFL
jgi:hypothetical protein